MEWEFSSVASVALAFGPKAGLLLTPQAQAARVSELLHHQGICGYLRLKPEFILGILVSNSVLFK